MMDRIYVGLFVLSLIGLMSCSQNGQKADRSVIEQIDWLVGTWQLQGDSTFEQWRQVSPNEFQGMGYTIKADGDTVKNEFLQLVEWEGELVYLARVPDQNDGRPIAFPLRYQGENIWVFENRQHDFPQQIKYICSDSRDTCTAFVRGMVNGQERETSFNLIRHE